jgi:hypothetical protein
MIPNKSVSLIDKVMQGKENIVSDMGEEKVMLSIANGKYYNLGELGSEIWDLMKEPTLVENLVTALMSSYDVTYLECKEQVISFLNNLFNEGLIEII